MGGPDFRADTGRGFAGESYWVGRGGWGRAACFVCARSLFLRVEMGVGLGWFAGVVSSGRHLTIQWQVKERCRKHAR